MKTIQALSAPRIHEAPSQKRAPLTAEEKKEKRDTSKENQAQIDAAVAEFFSYAQAKAVDLGKRFDKQLHYFLDIFFQGGAHMVNHHEKIYAFNAFKSEKAAERREAGATGLKAQELHEQYKAEYDAMTEEEKKELVERLVHDSYIICPSLIMYSLPLLPQCGLLSNQMHGLSYRVGIEGVFCIVRNSPSFYMNPQWYFTSPELERYMPLAVRRKWDTAEVGCRLEAFAVAGCDTMSKYFLSHLVI
ncbi:hypothetical protein C8R45DRAFT_843716 [Mycena sanguinolenta]|nr:hypothetical protein C8R45DRAFT_843716 [Mycena sanguinolenta]